MSHPKSTFLSTFLFFVTLLHSIGVEAQRPFIKAYTVEDGLLSQEVINLFSTSNGELWLEYSIGEQITKFDGINIKHYNLDSISIRNRLFVVGEDKFGLWFMSGERDVLFVLKDDVWKRVKTPTALFAGFNHEKMEARFVDSSGVWFEFDSTNYSMKRSLAPPIPIQKSAGVTWMIGHYPWSDDWLISSQFSPNRRSYFLYSPKNPASLQLVIESKTDEHNHFFNRNNYYRYSSAQQRNVYHLNGKDTEINHFVLPDGGKASQLGAFQFTSQVSKTPEPFGVVFNASCPDKRAKHLFGVDRENKVKHLLGPLPNSIAKMGVVAENGELWLTSTTGLLRVNNAILEFSELKDQQMVSSLHAICEDADSNIWFGGYQFSGFSYYDGKRLKRPLDKNLLESRVLPGPMKDKSGRILFFSESFRGIGCIDKEKLKVYGTENDHDLTGFYLRELSTGQIGAGAASKGFLLIEQPLSTPLKYRSIGKAKGNGLTNVTSFTEDRKGRIWLGHYKIGCALYDPVLDTAITWLKEPSKPSTFGFMGSTLDDDGNLWLATMQGVFYIPHPEQVDYRIHSIFDLAQRVCLPGDFAGRTGFIQQVNQYMVIGGDHTVYLVDLNDFKQNRKKPRTYTLFYEQDISGHSSEQNAIYHDSKGYLWIGTEEGASRIDIKALYFDTSHVQIKLISLVAGQHDSLITTQPNGIINLPKGVRHCQIAFEPSGNKSLQNHLFYDVFLLSAKGDTIFSVKNTRDRNFTVPYIPAGQMTLTIQASKYNMPVGSQQLVFNAPVLLEENPYFWIGLAALATVFLVGFFVFREKQRKLLFKQRIELEKNKRQQDQLRIQAISNFLDPHFIGNALHWIQGKYRKDAEVALVIEKLSNNMTKIFETTRTGNPFHSLGTEIRLVRDYLEVQDIRFEHQLQISLPDDEDLIGIDHILVPVMLLQIYAENAIEHGIKERSKASIINIEIEKSLEYIHFTIQDDGKGFTQQTNTTASTDRKSSTQMIEELASICNKYNTLPLLIEYVHLIYLDPISHERYGTQVNISLPIYYKYAFE